MADEGRKVVGLRGDGVGYEPWERLVLGGAVAEDFMEMGELIAELNEAWRGLKWRVHGGDLGFRPLRGMRGAARKLVEKIRSAEWSLEQMERRSGE